MIRIGIVDGDDGSLLGSVMKMNLSDCEAERAVRGGKYDVVLWNTGKDMKDFDISAWSLVICSEEVRSCPPECKAEYAVSCGRTDRDTVTLSSSLSNGGMAALRREIVSRSGRVIGPREIELKGIGGSEDDKLSIVSLLLLIDRL